MLIVLNLFIVLCLLGCVSMWATYGFFSAFIQLVIVIAAGTLAFALWEPISYALLGRMPAYAHGVGLLAPFVILLIVIRVVFDKFCKANVHMPRIVDQLGGGACGIAIGVLSFGILLNGVNFLPIEHDAMGWDFQVGGQDVSNDETGTLWLDINGWSGGFFSMISRGSMSPIGGIPLAVGRPDLSQRALAYRLTPDPNQFRSAHPGSVQVTGVYAIAATEEQLLALARRSAVLAFLAPSYTLPEVEPPAPDEVGTGLLDAILADLSSRFEDPEANGKPSEMLNIEAIMEVARTPQFKFEGAASAENFPRFIEMVASKMGEDLVRRLKPVLGENKMLYVVDTAWNNDYPGTFNSDGKLRIAITQVSLQVDDKTIAPIGYSIEYSQNTGGRIFTEIISEEADADASDMAYSKYTDMSMGWVFPLAKGQVPNRFFVRELRFDLSKLDKPEGQEQIVNLDLEAVARVVGAPLLPSPADITEDQGPGNAAATGAVKIVGTGAYAEVSEKLPGAFSGSAVSLNFDKDADPWQLTSGQAERVTPGKGGKRSSVREISIPSSDRLVRIQLDGNKAKSLYGRAIGLAEALNVMRVKDEGGNFYDSIGFALKRKDRSLNLDIREDAYKRGLSANELPDVRTDEVLMVYFQVPVGTKLTAYALGSKEQRFEETLLVDQAK
ncbi:MAG: hypothetical protein KTR15_01115 [Phycisphaeraceae bacterium]|nr:hypothetical protein [Phycisphaeraceae bacterium]